MGIIDLNRNWMFLEVARTGSFTAASKSTGIPKSTLSEKIQGLEDDLGTTLMVRTTRSLALTEAGHEYIQKTAPSIDQLLSASEELKQTRSKPRGKIRVSLLPNLANTAFTEKISDFLKLFPDISVELDFSERVVNLLEEGVDVAVRAGSPDDSTLRSKRIRRDRSILVGSGAYLRKKGQPRSVAELKQYDLVDWRPQSGLWHLKCADSRRYKIEFKSRISANNPQSVARIVAGGFGIALLPKEVCAELIEDGRLIHVLPDWGTQDFHMHIVYPSQRHLSAKLKAFIPWLEQALKEN